MHIRLRPSGGRGEYEVVGNHSAYSAASLEGWSFFMAWPDGITRDTGLWLDPGGSGKPRLRSLFPKEIQIGRIVASMLLMPGPIRELRKTGEGLPVLRRGEYAVNQVGFSPESDFAEIAERVTFRPSWIEGINSSDSIAIGVEERWRRVQRVYDNMDKLPDPFRNAVAEHRDYLASGESIHPNLSALVARLVKLCETNPEFTEFDGDPLRALERHLRIPADETQPSLPPPDALSEDEPEISARSAHQYRMARVRGNAGRAFSRSVRLAYRDTCAFCGGKYGGIDGVAPGVDAAHILAWSKYDLDVTSNALMLCKIHHWAFDAGIMMPVFKEGNYYIRFTSLADLLDDQTRSKLGSDGSCIPDEWLPSVKGDRPSRNYLARLYADLGVTFPSVDGHEATDSDI